MGDGALGFWKALRDVWPETREQRCWVHRIANVLDKLRKRLHGKAKAAPAHRGLIIRTDNEGMNHAFGHSHSETHPRRS